MFVELFFFFFKKNKVNLVYQFLFYNFNFTSKIINKYCFKLKILKAKLRKKEILIKTNY